jgi:FG-GAP-like repeat
LLTGIVPTVGYMDYELSSPSPLVARSQALWASSNTIDVLWRQPSGQMAASALRDSQAVATWQQSVDPGWQVLGTGDVNRDHQPDILWRNSSNGIVLCWVMNANGSLQQVVRLPEVPDLSWQMVGVGDGNGDGHPDLLWRNVVYGINLWWEMPAYQVSMTAWNPQSGKIVRSVDADWQASGVGDVNHDGISDIFWYHRPSGSNAQWWLMSASGSPYNVWGVNAVIPAGSAVTATVDTNGDGQLDLLLQDQWGNSYQWLMKSPSPNGTIDVLERSTFASGLVGSGWQMVGAANSSSGRAASSMAIDPGNSLSAALKQSSGVFTTVQSIGGDDLKDFYSFGLTQRGIFTASLSDLAADADLKLIVDKNANATLDLGDDVVWQWERGTQSDAVRRLLEPGNYYLEVSSYDGKRTNYKLQTGLQALGANDPDPLKFDIQISYGRGSEQLNAAQRAAIEEAALFWENVIPDRTNNRLGLNGPLTITIATENLNLKDGNPDQLTLAYSGPQVVSDGTKLRLQSGMATINGRRLASLAMNDLRTLLVHEFSHVLGFGTLWEPLSFRATDGSIVKIGTRADRGSLIDRATTTYRADSYAGWAYGELLQAADRATTIVPTAVPIEPQYFAHWAENIFQTESLTPVAPNAGTVAPISQLTLAALKDLGWNVNFGMAMAYQLPEPLPVASDIDFANLSLGGARSIDGTDAATTIAQTSVHTGGCGCRYHLANSVTPLSMVGTGELGESDLRRAMGLDAPPPEVV